MKKYISVEAAYSCWRWVRDKVVGTVGNLDRIIARRYYKYVVDRRVKNAKD